VAACPAGAVTQNGFTNDQVMAEIEGILGLVGTSYASFLQEKA
jgi:hypothetical protein